MGKWLGVFGIVLILIGALLIRFPVDDGEGVVYTGLFVSQNIVEYPVLVEVVPSSERNIGVSLEDYELDFGVLAKGLVAHKSINLESEKPVRVRIWADGNISGMVDISKPDFVLDGPDSVEISLNATDTGSYSGSIIISTSILNYPWLEGFTPWI
jgi:hypothetical protein